MSAGDESTVGVPCSCGYEVRVRLCDAGRRVQCERCQGEVVVPAMTTLRRLGVARDREPSPRPFQIRLSTAVAVVGGFAILFAMFKSWGVEPTVIAAVGLGCTWFAISSGIPALVYGWMGLIALVFFAMCPPWLLQQHEAARRAECSRQLHDIGARVGALKELRPDVDPSSVSQSPSLLGDILYEGTSQ